MSTISRQQSEELWRQWCGGPSDAQLLAIHAVVAAQWAVGIAWLDAHTFLDELSVLRAPEMHRAVAVGKANGAWNIGAEIARLSTAYEIVMGKP